MIQNPMVGEVEWVIPQLHLINVEHLAPIKFEIVRLKIESIECEETKLICHMEGGLHVAPDQLFRTKREAKQHVVNYINNKIDLLKQLCKQVWDC